MNKTIAMLVTSVTGNTNKLADAVERSLTQQGYTVIRKENAEGTRETIEADAYLIFFWCRKSTLNDMSMKMVDMYQNQKMLAIGTMGSYPTGEYGDLVRYNVDSYISQKNTCGGVYLSQGAIKPERTEKRRQLPPGSPHYLDDEGYKRHLESRKHPDQKDVTGCVKFVNEWLRG